MVAIPYDEIASAFEFVSSAPPMEHNAYISLDTGQINWISELASEEDELPDDLDASDRYLAVPHKNDLDLGKNLALRFAAREMPGSHQQVRAIFGRQGAYRQFKRLLETNGLLEKWYRFEEDAQDKALREWCAENGIQIIEKGGQPAA